MNLLVSLKYLVALDDHGHFGRAALACHITQPALSNALRALESHFDTAIVKRGRNFAGFTPEGERVLHGARRMLREDELLEQDLRSSADHPRGRLVIGAVPTAMPILARFASMLHARHPGISPTVRSMSSVELEDGLKDLALDLGLGYAERQGDDSKPRLDVLPQYIEHYFLLRKARTPHPAMLQVGPPMSWREASLLPLCLLTSGMHNRTIIDRAFGAAGLQPTPAMETNAVLPLALSVLAGDVCSILPGALVAVVRGYGGLEALPLVNPTVTVQIAFTWSTGVRASRTMDAALQFAREDTWLQHANAHAGSLAA